MLVDLCESGQIAPNPSCDTRAIDLGCGNGADSIYLAERGFVVTGVDFSQVAIGKALAAATDAGIDHNLEFVAADLPALPDRYRRRSQPAADRESTP